MPKRDASHLAPFQNKPGEIRNPTGKNDWALRRGVKRLKDLIRDVGSEPVPGEAFDYLEGVVRTMFKLAVKGEKHAIPAANWLAIRLEGRAPYVLLGYQQQDVF